MRLYGLALDQYDAPWLLSRVASARSVTSYRPRAGAGGSSWIMITRRVKYGGFCAVCAMWRSGISARILSFATAPKRI
jgi:hypothetical protein